MLGLSGFVDAQHGGARTQRGVVGAEPDRAVEKIYPASAEHPTPAWFVDVAAKAGITVRNVNGSEEHKGYIIEATGSGVAILDYARDGWPDIFLVNGTELRDSGQPGAGDPRAAPPSNHLLRNNHDG